MRRAAAVLALAAALAGCAGAPAEAPAVDLARAGCPADVRIRTDALPRVEQGGIYRLLGDDIRVNPVARTVSGELVAGGRPTGVRITIMSGDEHGAPGGAEAMDADHRILLAQVDSDDALLDAGRFPVVGVVAPLERDPAIVFWDREVYPVPSLAVLGISLDATDDPVTLRGAAGDPTLDFLVGARLFLEEQIDPAGDGTLDAFLEAGGQIAQVGDATIEPYLLEQSEEWDGELDWKLVSDQDYPRYGGMLAARPERLIGDADCLAALVPVIQQATADFARDPEPTLTRIVELAAEFGAGWYTRELAEDAHRLLRDRGMLADGEGTVGDFDWTRLQRMIDTATAAFRERGLPVPDGVSARDLATNAFIDPSITAG